MGCFDALTQSLLPQLPARLPATICIVLHSSPTSPRILDRILGRATKLPVKYAEHLEKIRQGTVYVAPPDNHLLVEDSVLVLDHGPRENWHRPAADPLLRTAAEAYKDRVIGVVLTGNLDDGARGLGTVKKHGGVTIVQDPHEALAAGMPWSALQRVDVDYCLPIAEIASVLVQLNRQNGHKPVGASVMSAEAKSAEPEDLGSYTCPECGGPLTGAKENGLIFFRCRVGHAYSPDSMLQAQSASVESALWAAVQSLQQQADVRVRLAQQADRLGHGDSARHYRSEAERAEAQSQIIRKLITRKEDQATAPKPGN